MKGNQLMRKPKLLRALLILLFVAAPIQWTRAQIVLSTPKTTLGAVIKNIKSQSNYQFFYDDKLAEMPVNAIDVKNGSLQSVLDAALQGKGITYKIEDNIVYLSASGEPQTPQQTGQEHTVTGTVVDATGEALIGVNVQVKGNPTAGTITDFEGNYSLSVPGNGEIVFSYIGYRSETLKPDGKNVLNVTMQEDTQQIGEVVVTALGIKREKKMLGYAVQELKSDELNKTGDPSVTSALQGKVAGLQMNTSATGLGGSTKITIRGNSSLTDNNQPLWIVDGVPFSDTSTSSASRYDGVDRGSASMDINPDDIESISVLKGPNAAALYGSRAGNGVILITTKKGLNKWVSMDGKISLSRTKADNRPLYGDYGAISQLMRIPNNVRLDDLKQYSDETHAHVNWTGPTASIRNPYYVLHQRQNSDERWRAFGYYSMKINFTDWLHLSAKYAFDYYRTRVQSTNAGDGINGEANTSMITNDSMDRSEENFFESNAEVILMGDRQLTDNFRLGFNVGGNFMYQRSETLGVGVGNMVDKGNWMLNAANLLRTGSEDGYKRAMNSVFGSVQMAWKEYLSLDLTARNDWSSTLPSGNNSFFYPSANLSFVVSDFLRSIDKPLPSWVTFAKARLSAAQVGKDTSPYQLYNTYSFKFDNGVLTPTKDNVKMNDQLKPEIATSYEAGLDMKFLNNRLGFDFTYYYSKTKNQIMKVPAAAPWSGGQWVNAGMVTNQGVELMLYSTLVETKDFAFDLNVNMAHNVSKVKELAPEENVNYMFFNGDGNFPVKVGTRAGHKLGEIYATSLYKRNENGDIIVNENGLPMTVTNESEYVNKPIGNIQPKLTMSVSPTFTYKGITLSALFDMKFGGDIFSYSEMLATGNGLAKRTLNRGEENNYMMVFPGVTESGEVNTKQVSASEYYGALQAEDFIYDASFIKLKELSIGYSFPSSMLKKTPVNSLNVSFVARNLCYLMKHTPGTSPEGGYDTTMFSQAIDYASLPFTRTFGISINLGF